VTLNFYCAGAATIEACTTEFVSTFTSADSTVIGRYWVRLLSYLLWRKHFCCAWVEPWTNTFV